MKHLQQPHNKRFFRAKPSTTRLTTYRNDKYVKTPALSSRQSAATNAAGLDNADSEWSHVAWVMLMPCGSRKGGIVKGSSKTQVIEILRYAQNDKYTIIQYNMLYRTQVILADFNVCLAYRINGLSKILAAH